MVCHATYGACCMTHDKPFNICHRLHTPLNYAFFLYLLTPFVAKPEIDERASSPESISVNEGDTLTIWCNVSGTPEPSVSWQRTLGRDDPPVGKRVNKAGWMSRDFTAFQQYFSHIRTMNG